MRAAPTLLDILQGVIERTYQMRTGVRDIHRFVVGDRGFERIYAGRPIVERVGSGRHAAKVLVREGAGEVRVNIYYPDALIAELEARNPLAGLDDSNLEPFAVFVEELDHFLTLADRVRARRVVSLVELELHANVTKYYASRHFLRRSLGRPLAAGEVLWLKASLFAGPLVIHPEAEVTRRYLDADRMARRYVDALDAIDPARRVEELRRFHQSPISHGVKAA